MNRTCRKATVYAEYVRGIANLCTSNHYGQPIVRTELASNIISTFTNVDRVYDLTVVHPGVKHKLHTLSNPSSHKLRVRLDYGLNASWSTLKDQCRCMKKDWRLEINLGKVRLVCTTIMYNQRVQLSKSMPVCASLACKTIKQRG